MNEYVIRCLGMTGFQMHGVATPAGLYLVDYDPDGNDGYGDAEFTNDPNKARTFTTQMEAYELWRAVPTVRPNRTDGNPNRPLTAYTIEVLPLAEALTKETT